MHINSVQWRPCLHAAKRFACHAFWAEQESGLVDEREKTGAPADATLTSRVRAPSRGYPQNAFMPLDPNRAGWRHLRRQ